MRSGCFSPPSRWTANGGGADGEEDIRHHRMARHGAGVRRRGASGSFDRSGISTRPTRRGPAWSCVLIYMAGQWRDVAEFYKGRGAATARSRSSASSWSSASWSRSTISARGRTSAGTSPRTRCSASPIRRQGAAGSSMRRPSSPSSTSSDRHRRSSRSARRVHLPLEAGVGGIRRHRSPAGARQRGEDRALPHDRDRVQGPHRAHDHARTSRTSPTPSSRRSPGRRGRSTSRRATARKTSRERSHRLQHRSSEALTRDNYAVEQLVLVQQKTVPADATSS